ncbi:MAG: glycoside hydrolase family 13 protein [Anaerolineaceae bacterium]|nr:glycoside hydrolase family 13 protein [Anaerolineaceae bacterium]
MSVPGWVKKAIFYQIFPDRFANGDQRIDPPNVKPWITTPSMYGFHGGDLAGIQMKFDYLLDLGVNAIYLNPIFQAASNHRYDTMDYFRIDPKLGSTKDFIEFIETAHKNDIRVILDGVFNHCGRGFFAFNDILENGKHSPYREWFHVHTFPVDAYSPGEARDYAAWWNHKSLPKFNTSNPSVRAYLLDVARHWINLGADGWRLDVPNEIDDDSFWSEFRSIVKTENPEAYLLGEIWHADPHWVDDDHFDALMNYPTRETILDLLENNISTSHFADKVEGFLNLYSIENTFVMYNSLGSHDTARIFTLFDGDVRKVKLAFLFIFGYPGVPAIYYGDEIGTPGGKDPGCRRAFLWDSSKWNHEIRNWIMKLIRLRKRYESLQTGSFKRLLVDDTQRVYVFARTLRDEFLIFALNSSSVAAEIQIPVDELGTENDANLHCLTEQFDRNEYMVQDKKISLKLPPFEGAVFSWN